MKKTIIFSTVMIIAGLFIALGPIFLFKACIANCCAAYPNCLWATKVTLGMGMIITALGLFFILYNDPKIQLGMTIVSFLTGIMVLLTLHVIIGSCAIKTMECRLVTYPILTVLGVFIMVLSGIKIISLRKIK